MRFHRMKKKMLSFDHPLDVDPTIMVLMSPPIGAISAVISRAIDGHDQLT